MPVKTTIAEQTFAEFIRCPLRLMRDHKEAPELEAAKETLRWLLSQSFTGELPALSDVRARLETHWKRSFEKSPAALTKAEYRKGLRLLPYIACQLQTLSLEFEVMHPVVTYRMDFGRNSITGEYASLVRPKQRAYPFIVRLRFDCDKDTELRFRGPDPVNMARWLHFRNWETGHPMVRVLNWAIDKEESWTDFFNEKIVRQYLNNASLNIADKRPFASPGPHCQGCGDPCVIDAMEAFPVHG